MPFNKTAVKSDLTILVTGVLPLSVDVLESKSLFKMSIAFPSLLQYLCPIGLFLLFKNGVGLHRC